jgi:hypothetical protein
MPDLLRCSRCGSDAIIPHVRVLDRDEGGTHRDLQVEVQRRPNALLFKRPERSKISAQVCGACGYAELYAETPRALHEAYLHADTSPAVSALEELDRTREALADSQLRLQELEEKLAFVEQLLEPPRTNGTPPKHARLPRG